MQTQLKTPTTEYMRLAGKIKKDLKHGQLKQFMKYLKKSMPNRPYSRGTVNHALAGYYINYKHERVEYQNLELLDCLTDFLQKQAENEEALKTKILDKL